MNYFICLYFHIQKKISPLQKAVYRNHTETASLLKECGGDLSIDTKVKFSRVNHKTTMLLYICNIYIYIYILYIHTTCFTLLDVTLI